jgi:hypothetical protein
MASFQPPPPAYNEVSTQPSQLEDDLRRYKVNRKPVPTQSSYTSQSQYGKSTDIYTGDQESIACPSVKPQGTVDGANLPPRPDLSLETAFPKIIDESPLYSSPARTNTTFSSATASTAPGYRSSRTHTFPTPLSATTTASIESTTSQSSATSQLKKAYQEARHFAGGLIQRPIESTKHFTILRHSHGLVFYQGSSTSLAISIFSDEPLPSDRTLWLQSKGWTGKTGMRAKALIGRNGSWLNVTPTVAVGTEQLSPTDERAWQRDFQKFRKKAPAKIRDRHQLRETAVVRIPAEVSQIFRIFPF